MLVCHERYVALLDCEIGGQVVDTASNVSSPCEHDQYSVISSNLVQTVVLLLLLWWWYKHYYSCLPTLYRPDICLLCMFNS